MPLIPVDKTNVKKFIKTGKYDKYLSEFMDMPCDCAKVIMNDTKVLAQYQGFLSAIKKRRTSSVKVFRRGTTVYLEKVQPSTIDR